MKIIIAAAALLLMAGQAGAQTQGGGAETGGGSTTTGTNSASGSAQAANTVNVIADAGRYAPADTSIRQSGHIYSTPNVGGSYFAGANPCLVGTGVGAAGGPIGFSINAGKNDEGCTRRSDAAAWHALGLDQIAIARMCQDQQNADAFFAATGYACPGTNKDARYKLTSGEKAETMALPAVVFSRAVPPTP